MIGLWAPRIVPRALPRMYPRAFSSARYSLKQQEQSEAPVGAMPSAHAYPFATHVKSRSHAVPPSDSIRAPPPKVKDMTRGVMQRVDSQLTMERDPDERIARLFSRRSPDCIPPGSIIMVESYLNSSRTSTTTFAGVLIAVRRAGIATTFLLRTIAHKLGVEMRYHAYSPMIKDIKVLQAATADKRQPGLTRTRRAKLYYMRRNDDRRVLSVANVVKQYRAAQMQEHKSSTESRKRS